MPSELANKAIDLISPSVGTFIAKAKVIAACNLAGLDVETLDKSQLHEFSEGFERTCATTLGQVVATSIKEKLLSFYPRSGTQ